MYLDLFKLTELPFRLAPDPEFLYLSKNHARAKAYMESTIWFTDGFVIITGEIGAGKTTLIETFLSELEKDVVVAQINQTQLTPVEFLQSILVQFGFEPFQMKKVELMSTLNNFLIEQYSSGRRVLLIIDEAQNLSMKVLEEVRMLSGIETTKDKVMRIILAGQPELSDKLDMPELAQLTQRVRLRFHLTPLSREDSEHYIQHRLEVAGSNGREIFSSDCYDVIFRYTGGVPRLINTLCDTAMMAAFAQDQDTVNAATLQTAIAELRWNEFTARSAKLPVYRPEQTGNEQQHSNILARVLLSHKGETLSDHELTLGRLLIGRTPENDVQIDSTFISRHHAQIMSTKGSCIIEDLNSTNGITHNGKRIRRRVLNDGDVLQLGEHIIAYMDERNMRQRPTSSLTDDAVPMLSETTSLPESIAVKNPAKKYDSKTAKD
ncbi:MAG: AAA family ATPase [Steroidobacteraceae bacterium]